MTRMRWMTAAVVGLLAVGLLAGCNGDSKTAPTSSGEVEKLQQDAAMKEGTIPAGGAGGAGGASGTNGPPTAPTQ